MEKVIQHSFNMKNMVVAGSDLLSRLFSLNLLYIILNL